MCGHVNGFPYLTSMPTSNPAGLLIYKVRTQVCLHHEKKISRPITEIIRWESRPITEIFCVGTATDLHYKIIFNVATLNPTNVASQLLPSTH